MPSRRSWVIFAVILLLAAVLRFYRIDTQSLWSDEGSSVAQALRSLPAIAANAAQDIHPPLYYILLHFWIMPFGTSETAVRSLSAVLGVALVAAIYALGRLWWSERVAIIAAFLAAVNPFLIYYAQEARMYTFMALLGAVCVYATGKAQIPNPKSQTPNPKPQALITLSAGWIALYMIAAILGSYTHYFFPIVLAVCNVVFIMGWWLAWKSRSPQPSPVGGGSGLTRGFVFWILAQMVVALAFLPWLPTAIRQITTWPAGALTFSAVEAPIVLLRTLAEGLSAPANDGIWLAAFALLLVVGAIPLGRANQSQRETASQPTLAATRWIAVLLYLFAPVAAMYALTLFKDAFLKFLIVAVPPFVLVVALGIDRITQATDTLGTRHAMPLAPPAIRHSQFTIRNALTFPLISLISLISFLSLRAYYFDPYFARDDYRSIVQTIEAIGGEGDAIILDAPGQREIFTYYYHDTRMPVYLLPTRRPPDAAETENTMENMAAKYNRLFVVLWATDESDPARLVESWLDRHAYKSTDNWYGNVRLAMYANAQVPSEAQHPADVQFGDAIVLQGYSFGVESIAAGDILPLTLFWRADAPVARRYKVFVHLLDPRGFVITQRDAEPAGGSRPTSGWMKDETVADPYGLFVPFGTPPLVYQVEIGLYDPDSGARLRTSAGEDHLVIGPVAVLATTSVRAIPGMLPLVIASSNGLTLLGYQLDKVGAEGQRDPQFRAGDAVHLTLYWRRTGAVTGDGAYQLQLGSLSRQTTPTAGLYPVSQWRNGEIVRDDQLIALPAGFPAGTYDLQVAGRSIVQVTVH